MTSTSSTYGACEGGELSISVVKNEQVTVYLSGDLNCPCSAMLFRNGQSAHEVIDFLQRVCQTHSGFLEDNHGRRVEDGKVGPGCLFYTFRRNAERAEVLLGKTTALAMGCVVKVRVMEGSKLGEEVSFQAGDYCADVVHALRRVCTVRSGGVLKDSTDRRLEPQYKLREGGIYSFYPSAHTPDEWSLVGTIESLCSWIEGNSSSSSSSSSSGTHYSSSHYSSSGCAVASVTVESDRRPLLDTSL